MCLVQVTKLYYSVIGNLGRFLKSYDNFVFGARHFFASFLWWKNVHILIFGIKNFFTVSKGLPMIWLKIWNMSQIIGFEIFKKKFFYLFQISKCTHFSTSKMMRKNVLHQKWSHSSSLNSTPSIWYTLYNSAIIWLLKCSTMM